MVEGLKEQLSVLNTAQDQLESAPVKLVPPPQALSEYSQRPEAKPRASIVQPLPEHVRESLRDLIQGSAEVTNALSRTELSAWLAPASCHTLGQCLPHAYLASNPDILGFRMGHCDMCTL